MAQYEVIVSPKFKKEFEKLPKDIQKIAKKKLETLQNMLIGVPLKYDLVGFYSIHFFRNKYRIIYTKEDDILKILAVHVGKRTGDFYKKFSEELKRRRLQLRQGDSSSISDLP